VRGGVIGEAMLRELLEREALQGVARKKRRRFVELHVAGRLSAAKHVVIHARQVVVDERVRMDHLDGTGDDVQALALGLCHFAGTEDQHRAHAFATTQRRVAHGIVQSRRRQARGRKLLRQDALHPGCDVARPRVEIVWDHFDSGLKSRRVSPSSTAMRAWASESLVSQYLMSSAPR
jgi:hypothetical protein